MCKLTGKRRLAAHPALRLFRTWITLAGIVASPIATESSVAQTFIVLKNLSWSTGDQPMSALVQGLDGDLYGTTLSGGQDGGGTVFRLTPDGEFRVLHFFGPNATEPSDGSQLVAGLTLDSDGLFYGTASRGGTPCLGIVGFTEGCGTAFSISPTGARKVLYSFSTDNDWPQSGLIRGADGNLYGTTDAGGVLEVGTVFQLNASGALKTLHAFQGNDGAYPGRNLVQATDGRFYGVTLSGGSNRCGDGCGTIFAFTPTGSLTTIYSFNYAGETPRGIIQATDGEFYGTTEGSSLYGGTVFKVSSGGNLTILHLFGGADGGEPLAGLIQATDGNFYGTALVGGEYGYGTIFKISPLGAFTRLHSFRLTDGAYPSGALFQATNGKLYGTAWAGGSNISDCPNGCGTIFSLDVGLSPFLETVPKFGIVDQMVRILGNNLTGSTKVSFHGIPAQFTVVSDTEIDATVPAGAVTGTVHVTTPSTTLASYPVFHVMPQLKSFSPASGGVGSLVTLTGLSLTPVKGVQFNGVQATFGVVNDTTIAVYVPAGATTGPIEVFSPGGTSTSTASFTVTQ